MVNNATTQQVDYKLPNEVENYLNSFTCFTKTEEYINQAMKRHIGILDYDQLYELYDNLFKIIYCIFK